MIDKDPLTRSSDETLNQGPDSLWSLKIPGCPSKKSRVLPWHPGQISLLASDHHGLLIIPIYWLASSLCLLSTNKLVCGGCSGALWLPSHHPGGCCTLVVDEEIAPLLCKALWVSRKALYKCNKLLLLLRARGGNLARHRGYTSTLYEKCHEIFNDHRESGPPFNISSEGRWFLQYSVPVTVLGR